MLTELVILTPIRLQREDLAIPNSCDIRAIFPVEKCGDVQVVNKFRRIEELRNVICKGVKSVHPAVADLLRLKALS